MLKERTGIQTLAYRRTPAIERRLAATRERLLLAARELVLAGGWSAATVAVIAAEAGVATGSVYTHYASRERLLAEVYAAIADDELAALETAARADDPVPLRLEGVVRTFAGRAFRGPAQALAVLAEPSDLAVEAVRQAHVPRFVRVFEELVAEGVADGSFVAQDPATSGAAIFGALRHAVAARLAADDAPRTDEVVERLAAFVARAAGSRDPRQHG